MFRNKIIGAAMLGLSGVAIAAPDAPAAAVDTTTADVSDVRILDTQRYVQTELDWRSYYLNRFSASRQEEHPAEPASAPSDSGS